MSLIYCQHCCQNHEISEHDEEECCYFNCGLECPVYQKQIQDKETNKKPRASGYNHCDVMPF